MKQKITYEQVREAFDYDAATGHLIRRMREGANPQERMRIAKQVGEVAGTISKIGYRYISFKNTRWLAHRLVWLHQTGAWPQEHIDHINGDRADNRIENLRVATRLENNRNVKRHADNASGFKGVSLHKRTQRYRSEITLAGRKRYLGLFDTPEEAHAAYCAAAETLHGEFARAV
jgi:hypothetical protein